MPIQREIVKNQWRPPESECNSNTTQKPRNTPKRWKRSVFMRMGTLFSLKLNICTKHSTRWKLIIWRHLIAKIGNHCVALFWTCDVLWLSLLQGWWDVTRLNTVPISDKWSPFGVSTFPEVQRTGVWSMESFLNGPEIHWIQKDQWNLKWG